MDYISTLIATHAANRAWIRPFWCVYQKPTASASGDDVAEQHRADAQSADRTIRAVRSSSTAPFGATAMSNVNTKQPAFARHVRP